jgi:quercetin dioxygenase-like cupin family protein
MMSNDSATHWVLGHKIRLIDTDDSYGMVEVTSPAHVPGPPSHYHKSENEFFLIIKGTLDVKSNGEWQKFPAGSFVDLPPNTTHTFINNTEEDVVWITGWRPKGFQKFFQDFGIPAHESQAQERSVAEGLVQNVVQNVERYGMYITIEGETP